MGCGSSVDAKSTASLEAAQRINDAIAKSDELLALHDVEGAVRVLTQAQRDDVGLLIGADLPAYSSRLFVKLADIRYRAQDFNAAFRLYRDAARVALQRAQVQRDGSYLMVHRYAEAAVGAARCHMGLLDLARQRLELARKERDAHRQRIRLAQVLGRLTASSPQTTSLQPNGFVSIAAPSPASPSARRESGAVGRSMSLAHPLRTDVSVEAEHRGRDSSLPQINTVRPGSAASSSSDSAAGSSSSDGMTSIASRDDDDREDGLLPARGPEQRWAACEAVAQRRVAVVERLLLQCVANVDAWHSHRSEMLIEPLELLARLYERLGMLVECERCVRKLSGVFMVKYGHSHPAYRRTHEWLNDLADRSEKSAAERAATRIVATWKMRRAVVALAHRLGRDPNAPATPDSQSPRSSRRSSRAGTPDAAGGAQQGGAAKGGGTSPRQANRRDQQQAGRKADFYSVFASAHNAHDEEDSDMLLRRQLEAAPKGPAAAASAAAWIKPAKQQPPSLGEARSSDDVWSGVPSPALRLDGVGSSSSRHSMSDDENPLRQPSGPAAPTFTVVAVPRPATKPGTAGTSATRRHVRATARAQAKTRVLSALLFGMHDGAAARGDETDHADGGVPRTSTTNTADRPRPSGTTPLWQVV